MRPAAERDPLTHIMFVTAALYIGGAERVVASLCRHLDPDRFRVSVCWLKTCGDIGAELKRDGYEVVGLPELEGKPGRYRAFRSLRRLIHETKVDILHSHGTAALLETALCRRFTPRVRQVHTFHYGNYPNLPRKHLFLEWLSSQVADRLLAVGTEQRRAIQTTYRLSDSRIRTVYNGVEPVSGGELDEELVGRFRRGPAPPVIIGSISTLIKQKGITYLLDAADALRNQGVDCVFLVAGDGPLRGELEEKRRALALEGNVHLLGWVPKAATRLLPAFDIFFQPSRWEAMSLVLLEAMAAGVPIVATDVGENRHVIKNGETGFVTPPQDVSAMVQGLRSLASDEQLRRRFGVAGRRRYDRRFTVDVMAANHAGLYEELLR